MLSQQEQLEQTPQAFTQLTEQLQGESAEAGMDLIKALENEISKLSETHRINSKLSKARRALRGNTPDMVEAIAFIAQAEQQLQDELEWRRRASVELSAELDAYSNAISRNIGMRMQERLSNQQAEFIAGCLSVHKDISLNF